jgi:hypothetical protein
VPGPLTFRGYYSAIYRTASRIVHGQVEVLDRHMRWSGNQVIVSLDEHAVSDEGVPPLVVPMTTFALLVYHNQFGWPDEKVVRSINYALVQEA